MPTRRQFVLAAASLGPVALAACGVTGQQAGDTGAPPKIGTVETTVVWQAQLAPNALEQLPSFLTGWEQKYPKVKIEYLAGTGGDHDKIEKILTMAAAGTPVDVIGKLTFMQPLARPGAVRPLEPLIKRDKLDIAGYNAGWLKTFGTLDGKLYSLPWGLGGNSIAFIYSPAALAEVGLKAPSADWKNPWKWDEYREYSRRLTKQQGGAMQRAGTSGLGNQFFVIPMQFGGRWISDDMKSATCDSPQMIETYTRYTEMILKDRSTSMTPGAGLTGDNVAQFSAGQVALSYIGGWQMAKWTNPREYQVDYTIAPFPKATHSSPDMDTIQVAVGNNNKFPEESWAFAKWLLEDGRYANLEFRMPTHQKDAAVWAKTAFKEVPATAKSELLVESLKLAREQDPVRSHTKIADITKEVLSPFWTAVLSEKSNVKDALSEAKRQIQGILAT